MWCIACRLVRFHRRRFHHIGSNPLTHAFVEAAPDTDGPELTPAVAPAPHADPGAEDPWAMSDEQLRGPEGDRMFPETTERRLHRSREGPGAWDMVDSDEADPRSSATPLGKGKGFLAVAQGGSPLTLRPAGCRCQPDHIVPCEVCAQHHFRLQQAEAVRAQQATGGPSVGGSSEWVAAAGAWQKKGGSNM